MRAECVESSTARRDVTRARARVWGSGYSLHIMCARARSHCMCSVRTNEKTQQQQKTRTTLAAADTRIYTQSARASLTCSGNYCCRFFLLLLYVGRWDSLAGMSVCVRVQQRCTRTRAHASVHARYCAKQDLYHFNLISALQTHTQTVRVHDGANAVSQDTRARPRTCPDN